MPNPNDIKASWKPVITEWANIIRRLQSVGASQRGYAIVSLQVMIDQDGNPVFWTSPEVHPIEPQRQARDFLSRIVSGMS